MINLDDFDLFKEIDPEDMLGEIQGLPDQLRLAWDTANKNSLPEAKDVKNIVIAGMGGSAIGADILASYAASLSKIPITIIRGYDLPAWVQGKDVLVICSSHSGNTEETISAYREAFSRQCTVMVVSTGGVLNELANSHSNIAWQFNHKGQPRSAVGFSFGMLLNLFSRLEIIPDQTDKLMATISDMEAYIKEIDAPVPVCDNLAKRMAGQAINRNTIILGAEHLEPIARRWKTQINELAKCWAQFEFLPEANHNSLAGLVYPEEGLQNSYAIFLDSNNYHVRNQKRMELTYSEFMVSGLCTDKVKLKADLKLSETWKMLLLGDYVSYYLAMGYEIDPTPIEALLNFKESMKS